MRYVLDWGQFFNFKESRVMKTECKQKRQQVSPYALENVKIIDKKSNKSACKRNQNVVQSIYGNVTVKCFQ